MDDHAETSLTDNFNKHGVGETVKHVTKHVLWMGAMMGVIALASPAAAGVLGAGGADPITLGNLVVQSGHGAMEMLGMIGDTLSGLIDIGGELISNTFDGNWAATTWDSAIMSHDAGMMAHDAGAHVSHAAHSVSGASVATHSSLDHAIASIFSTPMDWFDSLSLTDQMQMREDAAMFGVPFEEYLEDLCAVEHPHI